MAPVELTSPAEGKQPGQRYAGLREQWLLDNGYAKRVGDDSDKHLATTVKADKDPTLAANREAVDEYDVAKLEGKAKNAPEVDGGGEPVFLPGKEPKGPVNQTARPADLADSRKRAEADVKGISVDDVEESNVVEENRKAQAEADAEKALANAPVATEEPVEEPVEHEAPTQGEPTTDENVEGAAGDGQEVSDEEESRQDGDDESGAPSA